MLPRGKSDSGVSPPITTSVQVLELNTCSSSITGGELWGQRPLEEGDTPIKERFKYSHHCCCNAFPHGNRLNLLDECLLQVVRVVLRGNSFQIVDLVSIPFYFSSGLI